MRAVWWLPAILALSAGCVGRGTYMVVNVPLLDVRAQPHTTAAAPGVHDPDQETQLLYGEIVKVTATQEDWAQVQAVEQPEFSHHQRWQGYPGWVPAEVLIPWGAVWMPNVIVTEKWAPTFLDAFSRRPARWRFPLGTRLRADEMGGVLWRVELVDGAIVWMPREAAAPLQALVTAPPMDKRRYIVRNAELFLGEPYVWGGRSPQGVDCSGLINLAYRAAGVDIPRDAHEQFLRAKRILALQAADLIFLSAREEPDRIVHVMLYAGNGEVIEGPGTGKHVRRIALRQRLGRPLEALEPGAVVDGQTVSFGTYLP